MHETEQNQPTRQPAAECDAASVLNSLSAAVRERALRQTQRGWEISGVVLTQPISKWKSIVDEAGFRGVSPADMKRIMHWESLRDTGAVPGIPDGVADPEQTSAPMNPTVPGVAQPDPTLSHAVEKLAVDAGCCFVDSDPTNAGWRVPGKETVYASAIEALTAAVSTLLHGTSVAGSPEPVAKPREIAAEKTSNQEALF